MPGPSPLLTGTLPHTSSLSPSLPLFIFPSLSLVQSLLPTHTLFLSFSLSLSIFLSLSVSHYLCDIQYPLFSLTLIIYLSFSSPLVIFFLSCSFHVLESRLSLSLSLSSLSCYSSPTLALSRSLSVSLSLHLAYLSPLILDESPVFLSVSFSSILLNALLISVSLSLPPSPSVSPLIVFESHVSLRLIFTLSLYLSLSHSPSLPLIPLPPPPLSQSTCGRRLSFPFSPPHPSPPLSPVHVWSTSLMAQTQER